MSQNNFIQEPVVSQQDVYNGGSLMPINTEHLLNNRVAITQLLNEHNANIKEINSIRDENQQLKSELEYQKTAPFAAIFSTIVNICGTIVVGYGVNLLSSEFEVKNACVLIVIGGILVCVGNLFNVLYRWVRKWFNKSKN